MKATEIKIHFQIQVTNVNFVANHIHKPKLWKRTLIYLVHNGQKVHNYFYKMFEVRNTRTGNNDYKCKSCDKSFSQWQNLKKHILTIHEGHKDYKCKYWSTHFLNQKIWIDTFTQFTKITNVTLVGKHFLKQEIHTLHNDFCNKSFSGAVGLKTFKYIYNNYICIFLTELKWLSHQSHLWSFYHYEPN